MSCAPEVFGQYVEPFLDGGAVAIAMMERSADSTFHLSSADAETVNTWQVLASDADTLIALVGEHRDRHDRAHLAAVGERDAPTHLAGMTPAERAARFIYLRGGTDRDGSARDTVAFDETNARRLSVLLQNRDVHVEVQEFFAIVGQVAEEDLVYLDPPLGTEGAATATLLREIRSLVGTVTARGAYLLAPGPPTGGPVLASAAYAGWNTMALAADRGDGDTLWANRTLLRSLRH